MPEPDATAIASVRRFNRTVTQRVGALHDRYLSTGRSLGADRVLWEIGPDGCDVRTLRGRLELDSGYLSRILRTLEADGLVTVAPSATDARVKFATLTTTGRRERGRLDQRSDALAASFLTSLNEAQQDKLLAAMDEVERLLTAGLVRFDVVDPDSHQAKWCLEQYFAELAARFDAGFDPAASLPADGDHLRLPRGLFVLATLRAEPVGCGAMKFTAGEPAYLKRMWVAESVRGLGVGRRLLAELESLAAKHGAPGTRLETNRALVEAIAMYTSAGYVETEPFNDEPYAHHWFVKPRDSSR